MTKASSYSLTRICPKHSLKANCAVAVRLAGHASRLLPKSSAHRVEYRDQTHRKDCIVLKWFAAIFHFATWVYFSCINHAAFVIVCGLKLRTGICSGGGGKRWTSVRCKKTSALTSGRFTSCRVAVRKILPKPGALGAAK